MLWETENRSVDLLALLLYVQNVILVETAYDEELLGFSLD
jgi:hypothetical protein